MLKIFLVEDEYVVREGIKRINWQAHGYEFAGEAPDGDLDVRTHIEHGAARAPSG